MNRLKAYFRETYFRGEVYRRFFPYLRPYAPAVLVVVVTETLLVGAGLAEPWMMKILVDHGLGGQPLPAWIPRAFPFMNSSSAFGIVLFAVLGGFALKLITKAINFGLDYVKSRIRSGMNFSVQLDMFSHLQRLPFSYHDRTTVGDSIYRVSSDANFVSTMVYSNPRYLFKSLLSLGAIVWIVFSLDWVIAVLAMAIAPIQYISIGFYSKLFKGKTMHVRALEGKPFTIIQEVLSCLRVVKAFGQEEREEKRLRRHGWAAVRARIRLDTQRGVFSETLSLVSSIDRVVITLVGALRVLSGNITLGELMVVLAYVGQIHEPIETLGDTFTNIQGSLIDADRALQVLDVDPEIKDKPGAVRLLKVRGEVAFESVGFAYAGAEAVLHNFSLKASPGEVVALVGHTGAGKTTVANLLVRFYDPSSGRVTLDGHDLRDLTVSTLRDNIAVVLQEPILFSATIAENIAYSRPDASGEEIEAAARAANAHEFICELPNGYDSNVGERGVRLSGGERQRIALARTFLKDAPVLILDEPTSSIDSQTEQVILEALERLMVGRTTFIIAHRLSTTRHADQIIVMEKGRIVEVGKHDELMRRGGLYQRLHGIQFKVPEPASEPS